MKSMCIGIVGTGRMTRVLDALFQRDNFWQLKHSSLTKSIDNIYIFPLEEVLSCDIVFFAIPISQLKSFFISIIPILSKNNSLFIDICSVKTKPSVWMKTLLPSNVDCIASHPVFGPESTRQGTFFNHLPWVFSPIRLKNKPRFEQLLSFLTQQGIEIISMTPEEHDIAMSKSQAISFLFGFLGKELKLSHGLLDTKGFSFILENQRIVDKDSQVLMLDILALNPHAVDIIKKAALILNNLQSQLETRSKNMLL